MEMLRQAELARIRQTDINNIPEAPDDATRRYVFFRGVGSVPIPVDDVTAGDWVSRESSVTIPESIAPPEGAPKRRIKKT
jgi:hypothetical protein